MQFSKAMEGLPERWWFGNTHNDARTQRFDKHESKKAMKVGLQQCLVSTSVPCHSARHALHASRQRRQADTAPHVQERVGEFRRWVQNRPEKVVVAFGHSSIFHELTGSKRLKNCEVHTMHL